ncbi:DNA-binding response regulator [Leptospira wolffii]|uniref:response regulator n=1 Tax=Leptospira wolffii TaxID=409998 RepID=UPI001083CB8D|nr:response regulator transcription factor [Leptospira wolffii]TGK58774.1 DNA-binding response regulator [Leptospira wolffii]TGK67557.1 DNA-binding response regulator [Leptospira wolffii]TGK72682.1 DNA-binding response regulator [Leptospira wolffii]TGL26873.1 DNA-binding response regulator [Leptospira wolffii]
MKLFRIAVIEDDPAFAAHCWEGLKKMQRVTKVDVYSSAEDFPVKLVLPYDLVFVDIHLPGKNGLDFIQEMKAANTKTIFAILSAFESEEALFKALKIGAVGYILKKDVKNIEETASILLNGGGILSPGLAARVISSFRRPAKEDLEVLSFREKKILDLIVDGRKTKEIAAHFGTKEGTVRLQIKSIFRKLHVNSRIELVRRFS